MWADISRVMFKRPWALTQDTTVVVLCMLVWPLTFIVNKNKIENGADDIH